MRRKDREMTSREELLAIFSRCEVIRIAWNDENGPYIVPMNFGIHAQGDSIQLYMHGAMQGRKMDLIQQNDRVGFEVDRHIRTITGEKACQWSAAYESIIGSGRIQWVFDDEEREQGMNSIMAHYGFQGKREYNPDILKQTAILRLDVETLSGKANQAK